MTSKLDEIAEELKALDEASQATADFNNEVARGLWIKAKLDFDRNIAEKVRLLLAVAVAGIEFKAAVENDESSDAILKWQVALFQALHELEE